MKKWLSIIVILLIVAFASGCTTQPQTYSGNGVTFQYPGDWSKDYKNDIQQSFGNSATVLVSLGKDNAGVVVAKMNITGVSINSLSSAFKSSMQSSGYQTVSEKTKTVDGVTAQELVIKDTSSGLYGSCVFLEKNGVIYFIMVGTQNNDQATVDMVLNSFKVQ
jgi:hypothetical protein